MYFFELPLEYIEIVKEITRHEGRTKIAHSMQRDDAIGRRIAEKSRQHILNQRIRDAYARYQQQSRRR